MTSKTEIEAGGHRLQILHDELPAFGLPLPNDIVVGPGGASNSLLRLTPRIEFFRAWDMGCGSGVQAVALATHCREVIATDIDEKALSYTRQSAELNDVAIETRLGSLFEPVRGQTFDLIVSNPPFVIGQATELVHRESPLPADGLAQEFLHQVTDYLNENGLAIVLLSWLETADEDYETRISQWLPADCDVWVGLRDSQIPEAYVDTWMRDAGLQGESELRDRWLARLAEWNTQAVAFGWAVLQKLEPGSEAAHLVEDLREAASIPTGEEVLERMAALRAGATLTAVEIFTGQFRAIQGQAWRGAITVPGILSELVARVKPDRGIPEIAAEMAADFAVDEDDLMVLVLAGCKELVSLSRLELVKD